MTKPRAQRKPKDFMRYVTGKDAADQLRRFARNLERTSGDRELVTFTLNVRHWEGVPVSDEDRKAIRGAAREFSKLTGHPRKEVEARMLLGARLGIRP